jgi:signal transduction histidine kinase
MKNFWIGCKEHLALLAMCLLTLLVFGATFALYQLPLGAVGYPAVICGLLWLSYGVARWILARKKHRQLVALAQESGELIPNHLPAEKNQWDRDYQTLIRHLCQEQAALRSHTDRQYADLVDYYTIWAHQVKTPIAAMELTLQGEDSGLSRKLKGDLFRVEQYVEMVLVFLRLGSETTDYVIRRCDLDEIIRGAVKKFAGEFITRRLRLAYQPTGATVLTDEKWLSFVVEQLLSNALKYTPSGTISIYLEEGSGTVLCIKDTGMGIAPEDLPRVFEKGYTGYHGRRDKKASGLGLYLCKQICTNLGHGITIQSKLDEGTTLRVDLSRQELVVE